MVSNLFFDGLTVKTGNISTLRIMFKVSSPVFKFEQTREFGVNEEPVIRNKIERLVEIQIISV